MQQQHYEDGIENDGPDAVGAVSTTCLSGRSVANGSRSRSLRRQNGVAPLRRGHGRTVRANVPVMRGSSVDVAVSQGPSQGICQMVGMEVMRNNMGHMGAVAPMGTIGNMGVMAGLGTMNGMATMGAMC